MKKLLLASTALIALGLIGSAKAADLPPAPAPSYKAPIAAPIPYFSWAGFYVGLNGGYGWGDDPVNLSGDPFSLFIEGLNAGLFPPTIATNPYGWVAGGQIGWNYQAGPAVFGLEADIDAANIKSSGTVITGPGIVPPIGVPRTLTGSQALDWLATFRARLGLCRRRTVAALRDRRRRGRGRQIIGRPDDQ